MFDGYTDFTLPTQSCSTEFGQYDPNGVWIPKNTLGRTASKVSMTFDPSQDDDPIVGIGMTYQVMIITLQALTLHILPYI